MKRAWGIWALGPWDWEAWMIRAGRRHLVRTLADLAERKKVKLQSYLNAKAYAAEGFPAPISSSGSRTLLFDGEQVDAYEAGEPIPELSDTDDEEDLLDRREAAAVVGISPRTWDTYKGDPHL
ncbi:hypothetical protein K8369_02610, partial [Streptomyces sp. PSKA30]|nr:hypothetical protein [Streptomyces sp. PSKA30]